MEGSTPTPTSVGYSIFVRFGELDALALGLMPAIEPDGGRGLERDDLALVGRGFDGADREKAVDAMLDHAAAMPDPEDGDVAGRRLKKLAAAIDDGKRVVFQVAGARGLGEVPVHIERRRRIG